MGSATSTPARQTMRYSPRYVPPSRTRTPTRSTIKERSHPRRTPKPPVERKFVEHPSLRSRIHYYNLLGSSFSFVPEGIEFYQEDLYEAVKEDDPMLVSLVLRKGGLKPDDELISTAIKNHNIEIMELLIKYGANPSYEDVVYAVDLGKTEMAEILLDSGDFQVNTMLTYAVSDENLDLAALLLLHGADPRSVRRDQLDVSSTRMRNLLDEFK